MTEHNHQDATSARAEPREQGRDPPLGLDQAQMGAAINVATRSADGEVRVQTLADLAAAAQEAAA
jgi:hypothetical protein